MIFIEKTVQNRITKHSAAYSPNAAFGFLFGKSEGKNQHIAFAIPVRSYSLGEPFEIQSADFIRAKRFAKTNQLDLLGIYSSHSNQPNFKASMPFKEIQALSYVQISINEKDSTIQTWRYDANRVYIEEDVLILEPFYA